MMNEYGKSDSSILPEKLPNKAWIKNQIILQAILFLKVPVSPLSTNVPYVVTSLKPPGIREFFVSKHLQGYPYFKKKRNMGIIMRILEKLVK